MIEALGLRVSLRGSTILRGVTLKVGKGQIAALVGPNGAGKTTTLKSIMGLVEYEGTVKLDGVILDGLRPHERAKRGLGYSPEDRRLFPRLTVLENLILPAVALGLKEDRVELAFSLMPVLKELRNKRADVLSGGQQKLVALARAFVVGTSAVLLDEIFEGLSPKMRDDVAGIVREFVRTTNAAVLLAESNGEYVKWADSIFRINRGALQQG